MYSLIESIENLGEPKPAVPGSVCACVRVCVCACVCVCVSACVYLPARSDIRAAFSEPSEHRQGSIHIRARYELHTHILSLSLAHSLTHSLTHLLTCTLTCTCCAALFRPTAIVQSELPEDASQAARTQMYNERYVCHISLPPPPFSPSLHHASTSHLTTSPLSLCP